MKKSYLLLLFVLLYRGTICAQEIPERELVKARLMNVEGFPAAGFRVEMKPEGIVSTTDETGYFEFDSSTKNTMLNIRNPYRAGYHWNFKVTFKPDDNNDTVQVVKVRWSVVGKIVDIDGRPLKGIKVEVIGQDKSSLTNAYGQYEIWNVNRTQQLRITDTTGVYRSKIIQVGFTDKNIRITLARLIPAVLASTYDTTGVMYITGHTPHYKDSTVPEIRNIKSFKQTKSGYSINKIDRKPRWRGTEIQYRTGMDFAWVGRQPELQSDYAQGRTNGTGLEWRGPDQDEQFSWGPSVNNLEYSNLTDYPYDRNGSLVPKGTGNGTPANAYNPTDFFRTGTSYKNELDAKFAFFGNSILSVALSQDKENGTVRNSYLESYRGGVTLNKIQTGKFTSDLGFIVKHTHEKLMNNGANYAQLLHAVYTTPPTFDNRNGLSKKDAAKNSGSWALPDGSMRSYQPSHTFNPYYIISNSLDKEEYKDLLAYAKTKYTKGAFEVEGTFNYSKQWNDRTIHTPDFSPFVRESDLSALNAGASILYKPKNAINIGVSYLFDKNDESFDNKTLSTANELSRTSHQVNYGINFRKHYIEAYFTNKHYFSNTADNFTNLFPHFRLGIPLDELFYELFNGGGEPFRYTTLFGSVSRSLGEASLLYKNKAALSTYRHSSLFAQFYERQEIPFHNELNPEIYTNAEIGLRKYMLNSRLSFEATYFHNTTRDFVSPYVTPLGEVTLQNLGRVHNYGFLFTGSFRYNIYDIDLRGGLDFGFNIIRNKVSAVNHANTAVALAGFSNIRTVFAENETLGAIYGTTYQRTDQGQVIIDNEGFPLVDNRLRKIGDPTPDYRIVFTPHFSWKPLRLDVIMEYSHGGDRWNGTKAYLDYRGMSQETADLRNTKSFIFDGVTSGGAQNTIPVDFYNPAVGMQNNRWVRYGVQGVGEAYIEDASYFRIREITLSCRLNDIIRGNFLKDLTVSASLHNILLVTKYKGVDPESTLFGYATGTGLDLFNNPSVRSFSFSINLKF